MMHVGATLRLLRTDAGLSLRQLAGRIGVSSAYLSRVENGHDAVPTGERLASVARELSLPPELLTGALEPRLAEYTEVEPLAGKVMEELARRRLSAAQLERVLQFIRREFPAREERAPERPSVSALLPPERIILQLSCSDLEDALDVAASKLCERGEALRPRDLAEQLLLREREAPSSVGGGVAIPRTLAAGLSPRMALVTFARRMRLSTPDDVPLRALFVTVSPDRGVEHIARLARVAQLASRGVADALEQVRSPEQARAVIAGIEAAL